MRNDFEQWKYMRARLDPLFIRFSDTCRIVIQNEMSARIYNYVKKSFLDTTQTELISKINADISKRTGRT